jgi:hypothetical protein
MPQVWKQIIKPGSFKTANGWVTFSADRVKNMFRTGKAMLAHNLATPLPLEHDGSTPLSAAQRRARSVSHNTGWVQDWRLNADDSLDALLDVAWLPEAKNDAEIAHRLERTIKYVSPYIMPTYEAGDGKTFTDAIAHVALTAQPVWHEQQPFQAVGMARGFALSLKTWRLAMPLDPQIAEPNEATDEELGEPQSVDQLLANLKSLIDDCEGDVAAAIRACHSHLTVHHPDAREEEEEEGFNPNNDNDGQPMPAAPEPQYTALSRRGAGRRARAEYDPYGKFLNPHHPKNPNSH